MQFDDRLATVLRMQAGNVRAAQTQFRQLVDLAGSAPEAADDTLLARAYARLSELSAELAAEQRAALIREPGLRLRNPGFVAFLASQELPIASAAMANARLGEAQWEALVPALPIPARALLRHRSDLPQGTRELLARLGVGDLVLPEPEGAAAPAPREREPLPDTMPVPENDNVFELDPALEFNGDEAGAGIGALVKRIEAFRRARQGAGPPPAPDAPRLPLGELPDEALAERPATIDFATDTDGRIVWAEAGVAPMVVGIALASEQPDAPARAAPAMRAAMRSRQPVRNARLVLEGAPAIAGEWRADATPCFATPSGRFAGYRGRLRRPCTIAAPAPVETPDSPADRMRQMIHELRTPVNAIQGFAEIIQQQLFGPTPNEYRALAASIAGDAARMLAGFDELDRLVKLECGALELDEGSSDFAAIVAGTARQLDAVLRPRSAGLDLRIPEKPGMVAMAQSDADMLAWRVLATLAGSMTPGEVLEIALAEDGELATLTLDLPASLANRGDIFESAAPAQSQAVTAGMFGAGFTLRLARAEARAAGGDIARGDESLTLTLPLAGGDGKAIGNNIMDLGDGIADTA